MKLLDKENARRGRERLFEGIIVPVKERAVRINQSFGKWCLRTSSRRLKMIFFGASAIAVCGNILVVTRSLHKKPDSNFGQISRPDHIVFRRSASEADFRWPERERNEFRRLVDSLRQDSAGKAILKQLQTEGKIKLDSSLLKEP